MSAQNPTTMEEWAVYIGGLHGMTLWNKANAANTLEFVKTLQGEGYSSGAITQILFMFASQFHMEELAPPSGMPGQYLSFSDFLESA